MLKRQSHFRYLELAAILRSQIVTGYIKPGEFLLPENELSDKYTMSRTSVRKALQALLDEGLIVKMAGKGSIVNPDLVPFAAGDNGLVIMTPYPSTYAETALPLILQMFKAQYPNIEVNVVSLPYDASKLLDSLGKVGLRPDLVLVTDRDYRQIDRSGFADLTSMLGDGARADMSSKVVTAFQHGDQLLAVPLTYSPIVLLCNKILFARYGVPLPDEAWSLAQFLQAVRTLTRDTDGDGLIDLYGIGLTASILRWVDCALKNGVELGGEFDGAALEKTLVLLRDLLYRDRAAPIYPLNDIALVDELYRQQMTAMQLTSLLAIKDLDRETSVISQIPFGPRRSKMLIANGMMLNTSGDHVSNAKLFLQFVLDREVQRQWARSTNMLSVYRSVNEQCWGAEAMRVLDITDVGPHEDRFLHEVLGDLSVIGDLNREMNLFWAGAEHPKATIERIRQVILPQIT